MHHDDANDQYKDVGDADRFQVFVQDQEGDGYKVSQLNGPGNVQTERGKADLVQVQVTEIIDRAVKNSRNTVHPENNRYSETQQEGVADYVFQSDQGL